LQPLWRSSSSPSHTSPAASASAEANPMLENTILLLLSAALLVYLVYALLRPEKF
jgi:K+-transporting ATPase KdpF subunit